MHEIVTLQLGSQANYVGTHFWNTQESYFTYSTTEADEEEESPVDHDVHFRQGRGADGSDTYTPRTVIYDFKPNYGTLRALNELYDVVGSGDGDYAAQSLWPGSTNVQRDPPIETSQYQQGLAAGLEPSPMTSDRVRFWSDYSRVFYSPKSTVQIYETELNPGQTAFEDWAAGEELFRTLDREEGLFDQNLRAFVEECDQMQGLQLLTSADDGWAGFSARFVDQIRDELGKSPVWVWACSRSSTGVSAITAAQRAAVQARSLVEVAQQASLYVPLVSVPRQSPPWARIEAESAWSRAGLQLAAMETAGLPSRLRVASAHGSLAARATMDSMTAQMDQHGNRSIVSLECEARVPAETEPRINGHASDGRIQNGALTQGRQSHPLSFCSFSPYNTNEAVAEEDHEFSATTCVRGEAFADANSEGEAGSEQQSSSSYATKLAFPLLSSFPGVFAAPGRQPPRSGAVSLQTRLSSSARIGNWARALATQTPRYLALDERENMVNSLNEIADAYRHHNSSDEDWD